MALAVVLDTDLITADRRLVRKAVATGRTRLLADTAPETLRR